MQTKLRPRRGRAFWARIAAELVSTGESQVKAAARLGLPLSTLQRWTQRLRRERPRVAVPLPRVRVLPVAVTPPRGEARDVGSACAITVVRFGAGTDPAYVAAVVRALDAA